MKVIREGTNMELVEVSDCERACNVCGADAEFVVEMVRRWICKHCLKKALALFPQESAKLYRFHWANNDKRKTLKGRTCRIVSVGIKNSVMVEFENGQREIVSRRALRRVRFPQESAKERT